MSAYEPQQYIELIIQYLKDEKKLQEKVKSEELKELKEIKIDIFSNALFQQLYWNLLYFYTIKKENSKPKEQEFLLTEIVELLQIIFESNSSYFFKSDIVKSMLIFAVFSYKETIYMNLESILKIFLKIEDILERFKSNKEIEKEVLKFEVDIIPTIKSLINKYSMDFERPIKITSEKPNFNDLITVLKDEDDTNKLPFYLSGFINYNKQFNHKKYLLIKIYKYLEIINPHKNNELIFKMFQGYALYGILSYENYKKINFNNFHEINIKRMTNNFSKDILKLSIDLLGSNNFLDFKNKLNNIIFENGLEAPKINDIFDNTDDYYKDLYFKLKYFLYQYKYSNKVCQIITFDFSRVLWLNFCKLLLLNLNEEDIAKNDIKIIFFLIVNLFSQDTDKGALEFRNDAVSVLFSQCNFSSELLTYQEIYKIIDKEYSFCYPDLETNNNFTNIFIERENEKLIENMAAQLKGNLEIKNIKQLCKELPFHLLKKYLKELELEKETKILESQRLYNFYKNCYIDLDDFSKKSFIKIIKDIKNPNHEEDKKINQIINDNYFMGMIINIMKSVVMNDAYKNISRLYSTDGKYNYNKEMTEEEKKIDDSQNSISQSNLINGQPITYYYESFCNSMEKLLYSNRFIVMALPEEIKGFTFRFLKIVINSEGADIVSKNKNVNDNDINILLKAYLVFIVIHELNHFMKRQFNKNQTIDVCRSPKIKGFDDEGEGGKQLIKLLFGDVLINKYLNIEQAKYILDMKNWSKKSVNEFREDFLKIETSKGYEDSIVYLISEKMSFCDHSKLFA